MDDLLQNLINAANTSQAEQTVKALLLAFVADPEAAAAQVPAYQDDDVILFENEHISIWFCRFPAGKTVPPHDHRMSATIAVYRGIERNDVFTKAEDGQLMLSEQIDVRPGEVVQLASDVIHGVTCISPTASEALHVYLGPLSKIDRSLFDVQNNEELAFTDEVYDRLADSAP